MLCLRWLVFLWKCPAADLTGKASAKLIQKVQAGAWHTEILLRLRPGCFQGLGIPEILYLPAPDRPIRKPEICPQRSNAIHPRCPTMRVHFDRILQAGGISRQFHFLQIRYATELFQPEELWYHVTVMTDDELLLFRMRQNPRGEWKIDNQVMPEWVFLAEPDLQKILAEEH
jgi:hypothetical protein